MQTNQQGGDTPAHCCKGVLSAYSKLPLIRAIPRRAVGIVLVLIGVNLAVWVAVGIVSHFYDGLAGLGVLAWTLGLRHALDADHISAIDLMTRRLVAADQRPVTVGTFFSLGHSTIVIITSLVVAATAASVSEKFSGFSKVGGIIGSAVSAAFLLLLGVANAYILLLLGQQLRRTIDGYRRTGGNGAPTSAMEFRVEGGGVFFRIFKRLFVLINRPWKMYPLGILFGLGFDTSSQVALLGISAVQSASGRSFWLILVFPLLFTVGMCLIDTLDGALMLSLYTAGAGCKSDEVLNPAASDSVNTRVSPKALNDEQSSSSRYQLAGAEQTRSTGAPARGQQQQQERQARPDALTLLYYNVILTVLTVVVAVVIGVIQILGLADSICSPQGKFWDGVRNVQDKLDIVGGAICGTFAVVGILSVLLQKRWRRWVLAERHSLHNHNASETPCSTA